MSEGALSFSVCLTYTHTSFNPLSFSLSLFLSLSLPAPPLLTHCLSLAGILEPGSTVDGMDMVTNFLQRPLDEDAYLISCGLLPAK